MGKRQEKAAKIRRIKDISFKDGRLVPAREIKSRARQYEEGGIEPKPGRRGRQKGYRPKCKKCGEVGHLARTCKKEDDVKPGRKGRKKGYRPKCKKCGETGHFAKTCKKEDGAIMREWLFDE